MKNSLECNQCLFLLHFFVSFQHHYEHPLLTFIRMQNGYKMVSRIAGENGKWNGINQLNDPIGLYVDDEQTVCVADWTHQLNNPHDVIVDKERDNLII
jgi:hypothetical protein